MAQIKEINKEEQKLAIAAEILSDLPEWFGIPDSTQAYIEAAGQLRVWGAYEGDDPLGFISLSYSSEDRAEIDCLAIKKDYHRQGIGSKLVKVLEMAARQQVDYLQVKTVAPGHYPTYDRTNAFYQAQGFKKLEIFPRLWDSHNPCMVLIKKIS